MYFWEGVVGNPKIKANVLAHGESEFARYTDGSSTKQQVLGKAWSIKCGMTGVVVKVLREARLAYVSSFIGREIESFNDLTNEEATIILGLLCMNLKNGTPIQTYVYNEMRAVYETFHRIYAAENTNDQTVTDV